MTTWQSMIGAAALVLAAAPATAVTVVPVAAVLRPQAAASHTRSELLTWGLLGSAVLVLSVVVRRRTRAQVVAS